MCDDNHPFVLDKKWFVKRRELAESGLLESHTREDTQRFPTVRSTLAASLSMKTMKVTVDKEAGAAYITLVKEIGKGEARNQVIAHGGDVILDFDKKGRLLGVELLHLRMLHPDLAEGDVVETHAR